MKKRIGFIGPGLMGHGVAGNILDKGWPLAVLGHKKRPPVDDLTTRGAREVKAADELAADADVVLTCLPNSDVVEQVVLGPRGLRAGAREGLVIVDLTTGLPGSTLAIAEALTGTGIQLLDAPMTLTPKEAEEGRLNLLVGGERALFDELTALFETFAARLFYTGPLGSAHTLKLINNFLGHGNNALVVEAVATALKAGVDPHMMRELISVSGGNSTSFQRLMRVVCGDAAGGGGAFTIENALKDVRYYTHVADDHDVYGPLGDAVRRFYHRATALGYGQQMLPELLEVQGRLCGARLKPEGSGGGEA